MARMELQEMLDPKVVQALKDFQAQMEVAARRAREVFEDLEASLDPQDKTDSRVHRANQDQQAIQESKVRQVYKGHQVSRAQPVRRGTQHRS